MDFLSISELDMTRTIAVRRFKSHPSSRWCKVTLLPAGEDKSPVPLVAMIYTGGTFPLKKHWLYSLGVPYEFLVI